MSDLFATRRYLIPFRSSLLPQIFTDTLIIGSGVGGLRAAIAAASHGEVIVLGKEDISASNTAWAQGGIAAAIDSSDTAQSHITDTLIAGAGLCDVPAVKLVIEQGIERVRELIEWGMRFDNDDAGNIKLGREGGHSLSRILHADGDATGRELVRCLWAKVKQTAGVRVFNNCFAIDLITAPSAAEASGNGNGIGTEAGKGAGSPAGSATGSGHGARGSVPGPQAQAPVMGAITHHPKHGLQVIWAKATIVATGGAGVVYRETSNPRSATGDGIAMAWRAGASVADMAFVQFHPTTLYLAGAPRSLITEAVRGEGAHLVDDAGERFMLGEHPLAELAPRDIVTRAIVRRIAARGKTHAFLDCRHIPNFATKFPGISAMLHKFDLDPAKDLIPVHPAAHYQVGGVLTDLAGRTDVPGLYVVGESSCTGLHGANRLASNSLLEGLVFGEIAGATAREQTHYDRTVGAAVSLNHRTIAWAMPPRAGPIPINSNIPQSDAAELDLEDVERSLRSAMWRNVGIERSGPKLRDIGEMIQFWGRYTLDKVFDDVRGWQVQNMLTVAALIARSANWRLESRGCHWRADYPDQVEKLLVHDVWQKATTEPELVPIQASQTATTAAAGE